LRFRFAVFSVYAVFNFVWLLNHSTPEIVNGQHALSSHGFVPLITREEFIKKSDLRGALGIRSLDVCLGDVH
jgi:hypothetical protein